MLDWISCTLMMEDELVWLILLESYLEHPSCEASLILS
jgi:hypothetical protein